MVFAPSSLILTNYYLPLSKALVCIAGFGNQSNMEITKKDPRSMNTSHKSRKHPILKTSFVLIGLIIQTFMVYFLIIGEVPVPKGDVIVKDNDPIFFYFALLMGSYLAMSFVFPRHYRRLNNRIKLMYYRLYRKLTS